MVKQSPVAVLIKRSRFGTFWADVLCLMSYVLCHW